jgi:2-amino-4-hydroxy-6-hydroxymethyldihydropteridine diphosphokinase
MEQAVIVFGQGSNKGDSRSIITCAVKRLGEYIHEMRQASFYETEPLYVAAQPRFLNTAAAGFSRFSPEEYLEIIHRIESSAGRDRSREPRWGKRTLDIDILLYGDRIIANPPVLEVPHPRLRERRFALAPLLELFPGAVDPLTGCPYQAFFNTLPDQGIQKLE